MHGLGNDFIIVDARAERDLPETRSGLSELAVRLCDRNFGIGADGLILLREAVDADISMQIINSDGSEPQMCGNGVRCVAGYMRKKGGVLRNGLRVKTLAGIIVPEIIAAGDKNVLVRVDMGQPVLDRERIPMLGVPGQVVAENMEAGGDSFVITAVSMGNPHCVVFVEDPGSIPLDKWGPAIENHPLFPEKTNVEFVQVLSREEVNMRVWERGAGHTLACGTGACAAAVACVLNGLTGRIVRVNLEAGHLDIEWKEDLNRIYMTGLAEFVYSGEYPARL